MLNRLLLALAVWLAMPSLASAGAEQQVADRVFLIRDDSAKSISFWFIVNGGNRDETASDPGGISHYLEHLIFLGRSADHKQTAIRFFPDANANGFTNFTNTWFWQQFPARAETMEADLEKVFRFYSERLQEITVEEPQAERERNIVLQEFQLNYARNPYAFFNNSNNRLLQPEHPIGRLGIGSVASINSYTVDQARDFHSRFYARNNMEIVVHGPVAPETLKALAQKYLDPLPVKKIPEREWMTTLRHFEPMDIRNEQTDKTVKQRLVVLEKIVRYEQHDVLLGNAARSVLAGYLGSKLDGSLSDELVEKQDLAKETGVSFTSLGPGVLWITLRAAPNDGVSEDQIKAAMEAYLLRLPGRRVSAANVDRFKKRYAAQREEVMKDPVRAANALVGWFSSAGSYADWAKIDENAAAVSPDHIQPMLEALGQPGRQLFGILSPAP